MNTYIYPLMVVRVGIDYVPACLHLIIIRSSYIL